MSDCDYCDLRNIERAEPHRYFCPGLEIEKARDALGQLQTDHKEPRKLYTEVSDRAYKRLSEFRTAEDCIDSLQAKVHLCAGYDKLLERVDQLEAGLKQARISLEHGEWDNAKEELDDALRGSAEEKRSG